MKHIVGVSIKGAAYSCSCKPRVWVRGKSRVWRGCYLDSASFGRDADAFYRLISQGTPIPNELCEVVTKRYATGMSKLFGNGILPEPPCIPATLSRRVTVELKNGQPKLCLNIFRNLSGI